MSSSPPAVLESLLIWYARRFPMRRGKLRIVDALWRTAVGGGDVQRMATLSHGGFKMPCDLSEMLQRQFYFFGSYFVEDRILEVWDRETQGARTIFDVGANAGIYSLAALAGAPRAAVHAFEPTPEIAARLRATAEMNGLDQLHVHEVAVARTSGYATLRRCRGDTGANDGMNFITTGPEELGAERVRTVCLDQFCADNGIDRIDLLKLDIQGQEALALAGAEQMLRAGRIGTIFTELNWSEPGSGSCPAAQSVELLAAAGYRFAKPARRLDWRSAGAWLRDLSDVIARRPVPDEGAATR